MEQTMIEDDDDDNVDAELLAAVKSVISSMRETLPPEEWAKFAGHIQSGYGLTPDELNAMISEYRANLS
jgi:hypothetical protein